jgi:hypothetical protein
MNWLFGNFFRQYASFIHGWSNKFRNHCGKTASLSIEKHGKTATLFTFSVHCWQWTDALEVGTEVAFSGS